MLIPLGALCEIKCMKKHMERRRFYRVRDIESVAQQVSRGNRFKQEEPQKPNPNHEIKQEIRLICRRVSSKKSHETYQFFASCSLSVRRSIVADMAEEYQHLDVDMIGSDTLDITHPASNWIEKTKPDYFPRDIWLIVYDFVFGFLGTRFRSNYL